MTGTVAEIGDPVQQTTFGTGVPKVDKNGKPVVMLPVTLQTTLRDWQQSTNPPTDDDGVIKPDVGLRTVWLRYKLRDAVADAIKRSGAPGLRLGGTLAIKHTAVGLVNGFNVKEYAAKYDAPAASDDFLGTTPAPAAAKTAEPPF